MKIATQYITLVATLGACSFIHPIYAEDYPTSTWIQGKLRVGLNYGVNVNGTLADGITQHADNPQNPGGGSLAIGRNTNSQGGYSVAIGRDAETGESAEYGFAIGYSTNVTGNYSMAIGPDTESTSFKAMSIGSKNLPFGTSGTTWVATDPLLIIGNGHTSQSNAMMILKNGNVRIGTTTDALTNKLEVEGTTAIEGVLTLSGTGSNLVGGGTNNTLGAQTLTGVSSILTQGLGDGRYVAKSGATMTGGLSLSGASSNLVGSGTNNTLGAQTLTGVSSILTQGLGDGRYVSKTGNVAITGSIAVGLQATASGNQSAAFNRETLAFGANSLATGFSTEANGQYSFAGGTESVASGNGAFAMGNDAQAEATESVAFGRGTVAHSFAMVAVGRYNTDPGIIDNGWNENAPLFVVGKGSGISNRSDAFVVKKSGDVEINGDVQVTGVLEVPQSGDLQMGEFD